MNFDINPHPKLINDHQTIRLPRKLRKEIGVLVGQFMQISGKETLVLEIGKDLDDFETSAYVSESNFRKIEGQQLEFKILDVTLGCDPEFFIMWGKRLISATTYLPFNGAIGADGNLGELRPMYARHENDVVANLQTLITQVPTRMKRGYGVSEGYPKDGSLFDLQAHSYYYGLAAGFHVHMGIPPEILNTRKSFNRIAMNHLVKCFDWFVSVPLVPLDETPGRRLGETTYGQAGDYRTTNSTLEYRTPGGFYLRTPTLARGMMGLCLMVAENVVSRMKIASRNFTSLDKLTPNDMQEIMPVPKVSKVKGTLGARSPLAAEGCLDEIQESLKKFPNYDKHRRSVDDFFSVVRSGQIPVSDLIPNWKVNDAQ